MEFEPTIEPSETNAPTDLAGQVCLNAVTQFLTDKDRVAAATTPLEIDSPLTDPYELLRAREAMGSPTGAEVFYFRNSHGK